MCVAQDFPGKDGNYILQQVSVGDQHRAFALSGRASARASGRA